jgi:hypothetical protein
MSGRNLYASPHAKHPHVTWQGPLSPLTKSKRQPIITLSSTEVEYIALTEALREAA